MLGGMIKYLRSRQFKNHMYLTAMTTLIGYVGFLVLTINKPMFKPTRAETGGYDNYDEED